MVAGYFEIKVFDPLYPSDPLYWYDVGVKCPKMFSLSYYLPTEGPDVYDKRMMADIKDSYRTIHLTVLRPKPELSRETMGRSLWGWEGVGGQGVWGRETASPPSGGCCTKPNVL